MKDQETVQKFIELRSQGVSYSRIAEQLGVAKSTLTAWSREHQHLVRNLRAIEWEAFLDRTLAPKQERLKALAEQLGRLETELGKRDLTQIPTPRLQTMAEQLRRRIDHECGFMKFSAGVELSREDETRQAIEDWHA